jgi:hypothetical protein
MARSMGRSGRPDKGRGTGGSGALKGYRGRPSDQGFKAKKIGRSYTTRSNVRSSTPTSILNGGRQYFGPLYRKQLGFDD